MARTSKQTEATLDPGEVAAVVRELRGREPMSLTESQAEERRREATKNSLTRERNEIEKAARQGNPTSGRTGRSVADLNEALEKLSAQKTGFNAPARRAWLLELVALCPTIKVRRLQLLPRIGEIGEHVGRFGGCSVDEGRELTRLRSEHDVLALAESDATNSAPGELQELGPDRLLAEYRSLDNLRAVEVAGVLRDELESLKARAAERKAAIQQALATSSWGDLNAMA